MLYANGSEINLTEPKTTMEKRIVEQMAILKREFKLPVVFKYPASLYKPNPKARKGYDIPAGRNIKLKETISDPDLGTNEIVYAKNRFHDRNGNVKFKPTHFNFGGSHSEWDWEMIWFLIFVSTKCTIGSSRMPNKRNLSKSPYFKVEEKAKDAQEFVDKRRVAARVEYYILDDESPLTMGQLRELSKAYGVYGVDEMEDAQVRHGLFEKIRNSRHTRKYEEFIEDCKGSKVVQIRATIQDALESGVLLKDKNTGTWNIMKGGKVANEIVKRVSTKPDADNLIEHYMTYPDKLKELTTHLAQFNKHKNTDGAIELSELIEKAEANKVIYNFRNAWFYSETEKIKGYKAGSHPQVALINFFGSKDGKDAYDVFLDRMKEVE